MTFIFSSTYVFFVAVVTFSIYNISPIDCFSLRVTPHSRTKTSLHIFGKFAEAFSNDSFDKKENAGLTNVSIELEDSSILQVSLILIPHSCAVIFYLLCLSYFHLTIGT